MRFKQMKINGKTIDALLIAYGPDYKLYSNEGRYILQTGREKTVIMEEDSEYKIVSQFVVLKYQDISEQENIKNRFLELVGRLKNPSERYDRLMKKMNPTSKKIDMRLFEVDSPLGKFQIIVTENVPGEWKKYGITDKNLRGDAIEIAQRELGGRGANVLPDAVKIKEIPEGFFPSKSMTAAYIKRKLANNPTVRRGSKLEKELESYESLFDRDEDEQQIDLNQLSEYEKMLTFSEKQNPKGLASITTKKLKEIMDEPFKRGTQGADFEAKYGTEEIESEYYKRISKEAEKEMKKQLKEQEQYEKSVAKKEKPLPKPKKQFPITLNWEIYESLKETYAFLEIPDFPFYNVRIYFGNFFTVYVNDGYKTLKEKDFKTLDEAVDFAEKEFLALVVNDKDYDVNIGSVVK
jgi:hypothetical protein